MTENTQTQEGGADSAEYDPDFVLPHLDAIGEDNWAEYEAKGFGIALGYDLAAAQRQFGVEHVYTGHAFDFYENRPLRNKPGTSIYVDPEGLAISAEEKRAHEQRMRERGFIQDDPGGPSAN
jgi:hypothetical protein